MLYDRGRTKRVRIHPQREQSRVNPGIPGKDSELECCQEQITLQDPENYTIVVRSARKKDKESAEETS